MATTTANLISDQKTEIPPSGSWTTETTLPFEGHIVSIVTHSSDEIWVQTEEKLMLYRTSIHTWNEFSMIRDIKTTPQKLYEAKDGTLWGINLNINGNLDTKRKIPLLVRYDDETGQFAFVRDRDNILNRGMDLVAITEPAKNPGGEIWMLVNEEIDDTEMMVSLISFDPTNLQAIRHITRKENRRSSTLPESSFSDIAIPPDNMIWIADRGLGQLLYYDPASGISQIYQPNPGALDGFSSEDLRGGFNLFVDRVGRLWIDDRGWLDFSDPDNPIWHKVIRSSVFISASISPENQFGWSRPYQIYQSSDGMYWFSDANGAIVRLNPETGEWCKFTTGSSPIAEDGQGNLWIVVFGKLYSYRLAP